MNLQILYLGATTHIRAIGIYIREIRADIQEITADVQEIATDSREIGAYMRVIRPRSPEIAFYKQETPIRSPATPRAQGK